MLLYAHAKCCPPFQGSLSTPFPYVFPMPFIPSSQPMHAIDPRPLKARYKLSKALSSSSSIPPSTPAPTSHRTQTIARYPTRQKECISSRQLSWRLRRLWSLPAQLVVATSAVNRPGLAARSDLMSCEETYGGGWTPCGDEVSAHTQLVKMSTGIRGCQMHSKIASSATARSLARYVFRGCG